MADGVGFWERILFRFETLSSKLYWKVRLIFRALYASTTKTAARSLAHQLEVSNKATRDARSENLWLLKKIQAKQSGKIIDPSRLSETQENKLSLIHI